MSEQEKVFADGFSFKRQESSPNFVVGSLSMKVDEAIQFMRDNERKGWVNLQIKQARSGNYYVELDTWQPKGGDQATTRSAPEGAGDPVHSPDVKGDDLPF
jgi:hypothetical protein